jgi:5-methylcytosine-specific restriction endonuclease McrA
MFNADSGKSSNNKKKFQKINLGIRQTVLERARYRCQGCSIKFNTQDTPFFSHINGSLKDNRPSNLKALCKDCYNKTGEQKIKDNVVGKIRSLIRRVI